MHTKNFYSFLTFLPPLHSYEMTKEKKCYKNRTERVNIFKILIKKNTYYFIFTLLWMDCILYFSFALCRTFISWFGVFRGFLQNKPKYRFRSLGKSPHKGYSTYSHRFLEGQLDLYMKPTKLSLINFISYNDKKYWVFLNL